MRLFVSAFFTLLLLGCASQETPGFAKVTCFGHECPRTIAAASTAPPCDFKTGLPRATPCQCFTAPCVPPAVVANIPAPASLRK